ncbi:MAG: sulfatase [Balneolales bacterium]
MKEQKSKILIFYILISGFLISGNTQLTDDNHPYNVLLITVDDLNDWTGGLNGHPNVITPNMDTLGESGILFTNTHTQAPLCGPSRASFMSGLLPTTSGIYLHISDDNVKEANEATLRTLSLPEYFAQHGYKTMGAGKLWHGNDGANTFQEYGDRHEWFGPRPEERINYDPKEGPNYVEGMDGTSTDWGAFPENDEEMPDYKYASWVIERLEQDHDKPFFMGVGFVRPHVPWYVPKRWYDMHPVEGVQTPPYKTDDMDDVPDIAHQMAFMPPMPTTEYLKDNNQWEAMVQGYLASVTWADHQIGRVLDALEKSKYADNTIVVLFSDHGYHLGEKNRVSKMSLWERDTHVPLIFAGPGIEEGLLSSRPTGLIDIYPTLLELCNLPANPDNDGRSLMPLIDNVDEEWPYPVMTAFGPHNITLRNERYRYTRYEDGSEEVYDHKNDPNEWENLALSRRNRILPMIDQMEVFIPKNPAPLAENSNFGMNNYFKEQMEIWRNLRN